MRAKRSTVDAEYYLQQNYPVVLQRLGDDEGGGFRASIPQLGSKTFVAAGDTAQEALDNLEAIRQALIPELVAEGELLPDAVPDTEDVDAYSGNLVLRIPKALHAWLAQEAKRNGCSINKLVTGLLAEAKGGRSLASELAAKLAERLSRSTAETSQVSRPPEPVPSPTCGAWLIAGGRPVLTAPPSGHGYRGQERYDDWPSA